MTSPTPTTEAAGRSSELYRWALFCFLVFALKLLLFAIDPLPKLYMGDSGSYLWTAVSGWIPDDRSYFYGYVIRWTSFWTESLTPLLALQVCLSTISCILFASICRFIFKLPARWAYLFGFLCAIDPLQLLYERYVMTEAISLSLYAFVVYHSLLYLRDRRLRDLAIMQVVSVLLIGFRMSFLLQVQINTVLLPLIAFTPAVLKHLRHPSTESASRLSAVRACGGHLLVSVVLMFLLHTGYKRANGWVSEREPAYLHGTGLVLLAGWGSVLQPGDAADSRLADLISKGDEFGLRNPDLKNSQHFAPNYLIDRWSKIEPDPLKADRLAQKTALHALRRDPLGVLGIGWHTYAGYWNVDAMKQCAEMDFSFGNPPDTDLIARLASRFHLTYTNDPTTKSAAQQYYVAAWPYYFLILLSPLLSGLTIVRRFGRPYAIFLFVHISIMLAMSMTFGGESIRYLQPVSFMTLLVLALGAKALLRPVREDKDQAVTEEQRINVQPAPTPRPDVRSLAHPAFI
ncbi:MAG: hypothetical protein QOC70_2261 [Verrucomicrobiota bacterium]|jgi:hypothetical protein